MYKETVSTPDAPAAIGPYSQAVRAGDLLFISGQIPLNPSTGELEGNTAAEQVVRVLSNMRAVAEAAGGSMGRIVKTTIFLTDLSEFQAVNEAYAEFFRQDPPARSTIQVAALPKGAKVEIEAVAMLG